MTIALASVSVLAFADDAAASASENQATRHTLSVQASDTFSSHPTAFSSIEMTPVSGSSEELRAASLSAPVSKGCPAETSASLWVPVESYNGTLAGFPQYIVAEREPVVLTAGCDATLIGPDLAITAAHCEPKIGETAFQLRHQNDPSGTPRTPIGATIIDIYETLEDRVGGYEYTIFQISERLGDTWGWTKMAAVTIAEGETLGVIHGPGYSPEYVSAGKLLQYNQDQFLMSQSMIVADGSSGAGILDTSGFLIGTHTASDCCTNTAQGCTVGKEIAWHSSMLHAWRNSSKLQNLVAAWQVGNPGKDFAVDGQGGLYGIAEDGNSVWKYSGSMENWSQIGGPATELFGGGGKIYGLGAWGIYRYNSPNNWTSIEPNVAADDEFAVDRATGELYKLPADRQSVQVYGQSGWQVVGGPASELQAGYRGVFAKTPQGGDMWEYNSSSGTWGHVGSGVNHAARAPNGKLYRSTAQGVERLDNNTWTQIGGPAVDIYPGINGNLFARSPGTLEIWRFDGIAETWERFGRSTSKVFVSAGRVFSEDAKSGYMVEYRNN